MLPNQNHNNHPYRSSKITYKGKKRHYLAKNVCITTVALMFNINKQDIYRIECWEHVVYVHGKTVSCFVSYADFPPILYVQPPTQRDANRWKVRWLKKWKTKKAPAFWTAFYSEMFQQAGSLSKLVQWGELIAVVKKLIGDRALACLGDNYADQRDLFTPAT